MASLVSTSTFGGPVGDPTNDLMLPNGSTVGQVSNEVLRGQLAKLGIEGAHTKPRSQLVDAYAAMLKRIGDEGSAKAIDAFLKG
jgi:hypothetical protein